MKPRQQLPAHTMAMTAQLNGRNGTLVAANRTRSPLRLHLAARPARSHSLFQQRCNGALPGASAMTQRATACAARSGFLHSACAHLSHKIGVPTSQHNRLVHMQIITHSGSSTGKVAPASQLAVQSMTTTKTGTTGRCVIVGQCATTAWRCLHYGT